MFFKTLGNVGRCSHSKPTPTPTPPPLDHTGSATDPSILNGNKKNPTAVDARKVLGNNLYNEDSKPPYHPGDPSSHPTH